MLHNHRPLIAILLLVVLMLSPNADNRMASARANNVSAPVIPLAGSTTLVSVSSSGEQGNNTSWKGSISADGRFVAFYSAATNLVSEDTNYATDIFVHDRQTSETTRISVSSSGAQGNGGSSNPSISSDGRYIAFESDASNLVSGDTNDFGDIFVHDRQTGQTTLVSISSGGVQGYPMS